MLVMGFEARSYGGFMGKTFVMASLLCAGALLAGCKQAQPAREPHRVAVQAVSALGKPVTLDLPASAVKVGGLDAPGSLRDYRLTVSLPAGVQASAAPGSLVKVRLPTVHHSATLARVERMSGGKVELLLSRQVQGLNGRQVQVNLPMDTAGLCLLPFGCMLAPMGVDPYVFMAEAGKARKVPALALSLMGDNRVLAAAPIAPGQKVVVQGLDNLLDGDDIKVLAEVAE